MVEGTALEMRHTRKGIVGSNPTLSAITYWFCTIFFCFAAGFELRPKCPRVAPGRTVWPDAETASMPWLRRCAAKSLLSGFQWYRCRRNPAMLRLIAAPEP